MRGALLRSGKSGMFTALGETGQPVYRAALQLREAIRRKNPEMVDHLAIPQSDELGNQIDWYSGLEGDVIPWSSATEEERAPARVQLEAFKKSLDELSLRFLGTDPAEQQGDKAVFGKLLKRVIHFPDENFVYLVNGKPVLTFWGFEHAGADRTLDPLHCLYPVASPATAPVPPVIAPVDVTPPPVVKRSWWRRWWWLLPLLLLLLLLLFGLRGCWGLNVTIYPAGTLPPAEPVVEVPQVVGTDPTLHAVSTTGLSTAGTSVVGNGVVGTNGAVVPALAEKDAATAAAAQAAASGADSAAQPNANVAGTPPEAAPAAEPVNPPSVPQNPAQTKTPGPALSIPPTAADGAADFLNGQYRAGAGIQDRRTGKPLRLDYQFKDGKGEVTVHQANGVNCTGPVTAAMKGGSLSIDSQGQAVCADGSHYDMPKVDCRKGATSVADCTGGYGKEQFPMSMRQAGE